MLELGSGHYDGQHAGRGAARDGDELMRHFGLVAALALVAAAVAALGDGLAWPAGWALVGGGGAGAISALAAMSRDRKWPVVAYQGSCWTSAGLWVAWTLAHSVWAGGAWAALGAGALVFGMGGWISNRAQDHIVRHEAEERRRALVAEQARIESLPEVVAARVEEQQIGSWQARVDRACQDVRGVEVRAVVPWPGERAGYGEDVYIRLPGGGATMGALVNSIEALEVEANLPTGCPIDLRRGATKAEAVLSVSTADALVETRLFPLDDLAALTMDDPFDMGWHHDGTHPTLYLREDTLAVIGRKRSGKSNVMDVGVGNACRRVDALNWVVDLAKEGELGASWVRPWKAGQAAAPGVDWVATGWDELLRRTQVALHLLKQRQRHYRQMMAEQNAKLLRVCPGIPKIIIWVDEIAEILGGNVQIKDPAYQKAADNLGAIVRTGGQMGIDVFPCGLRATTDTLPSHITSQINAKIGMRMESDDELRYLFGNGQKLALSDLIHKGSGFWWQDSGRPRIFRSYLMSPEVITYIVWATAEYRSPLDFQIMEPAFQAEYQGRWERTLETLFPGMWREPFTVATGGGQRAVAATPVQDTPAWGGQDTDLDTSPASEPVGRHGVQDTVSTPEGDDDPAAELASIMAELEAITGGVDPEDDLEVGRQPTLRVVPDLAHDRPDAPYGDAEALPEAGGSRVSIDERRERAKAQIVRELRSASFRGLSVEDIGRRLEQAGLGASQATLYRWLEDPQVAYDAGRGKYVHPDYRESC